MFKWAMAYNLFSLNMCGVSILKDKYISETHTEGVQLIR